MGVPGTVGTTGEYLRVVGVVEAKVVVLVGGEKLHRHDCVAEVVVSRRGGVEVVGVDPGSQHQPPPGDQQQLAPCHH